MSRRRLFRVLGAGLVLAGAAGAGQAQGFENRTYAAGLGSVTAANGVAVADYDRDGDLDVYVVVPASYSAGNSRTWNRLFANDGSGSFTERTRTAGVRGQNAAPFPSTGGMGHKLGAAWGDYDNDGWPDLYLTHAGPNQLYRNNGDGTFTDVTATAGVAGGSTHLSTSALWVDVDGDGDLDLHVGVWEDYPEGTAPHDSANPFFENLGDGTFREVGAAVGLADRGKTYTTVALDVNGDGRPDLYNANDFGPNTLHLNNGDGTFRESTAEFGLVDTGHGMGLALGDPNGDGLLDVYVTNISGTSFPEAHSLFVAVPEGGYVNRAAEAGVAVAGWGWGTAFFDAENGGDEDLFVANGYFQADTPNALFENRSDESGLRFVEAAAAWGVADLDAARGVAVFDADGDGRLDLLVSNVTSPLRFYRNVAEGGAWLAVEVDGTASNRDAYGATVEVWAGGTRYVRSHHGAQFLGQNLAPVHVRPPVLIACVDGLTGFGEAIRSVYPEADVQRCIVHAVRQSLRFVNWRDRKAVAAALKTVYAAPTLAEAERMLGEDAFSQHRPHFDPHTYVLRDLFAGAAAGTTARPLQVTVPGRDVVMYRLTRQ